jgi:ankyrin repeat protein
MTFEGENYFRHPTLLEFTAENPVRHGSLPSNIVDMAALLLHHGAKDDAVALNATLELVASGRVVRECDVQIPLIDLLCGCGADPEAAKLAALFHGEFDAVHALLHHGAKMDLPTATALGCLADAVRTFEASSDIARHRAVALAAQHGRTDILQMLLDAGEDANRFNPVDAHSHSTPLHQAAYYGHEAIVRLLLQYGAKPDVRDILYQATPLQWARHAGQNAIAELIQAYVAKT